MAPRPFRTIEEAGSLTGKRVLLRAALNVPLEDGAVRDDFRIKEACKTIQFLQKDGARVIVLAHIGRVRSEYLELRKTLPDTFSSEAKKSIGKVYSPSRGPQETLAPVYESIKEMISIAWAGGLFGDDVAQKVATLADGEAILLENVRSDIREEQDDEAFAKLLAAYGEIFINDAFADSHRAHASIVGIPKFLPSYAGLVFAREYEMLSRAFDPAHPALFILGGAKFETKLPLVERFVEEYDHVFIGGALANDFLKGKGYEVGKSKVSGVDPSSSPLLNNPQIIIPEDVVVSGPNGCAGKTADAVLPDELILDIGPKTMEKLAPLVANAKTIVWNGPLGDYEDGYGEATDTLAEMIADSHATSIVGGGDTVAAIERMDINDQFTFISTAGGAMLEFLEKETLPGIDALSQPKV